jgi:peptidoglycan/xylan/chitin deacetylase (PgdA/CDA1 family)
VGYEPQREYSAREALNLEELKEMLPYVDFQSHTKFHPILTTCTEEECKEEIEGSKDYLGKLLDKEIEHFCYPNGDYTNREIEYVKNCGYKSARTLDIGWNDVNSDPYRLKTMDVEDDASINILCAQLNGFFGYLRFLRHGSFKGIHPPFI